MAYKPYSSGDASDWNRMFEITFYNNYQTIEDSIAVLKSYGGFNIYANQGVGLLCGNGRLDVVNTGANITGDLLVTGTITAFNGASGTFTTADGKTVTVSGGIITSIV